MKDQLHSGKFQDPLTTANGDLRAHVALSDPQTLWFNTGTLCNIECENCYILSSPTNDALLFLTTAEVTSYLDQLEARNWQVGEIGFTGGEPFMNPDMIDMMRAALARGYDVLVLTNAMMPMMRPRMQQGLLALNAEFAGKITLRISVDHYRAEQHDKERGTGSFERTLIGMRWLRDNGFGMTVAGRTVWGESEANSRAGYAELYENERFNIDALSSSKTVLFPEMNGSVEVPEITTDCWRILNKSPDQVMCASSRMVVHHKGASEPSVIACTLLPYDPQFDLGATLAEAEKPVSLNHPHCSKFCVLGGASCSN